MLFVRFNDHLDQFMANDVLFGEVNELDALEARKHGLSLFDTAFLAAGFLATTFLPSVFIY